MVIANNGPSEEAHKIKWSRSGEVQGDQGFSKNKTFNFQRRTRSQLDFVSLSEAMDSPASGGVKVEQLFVGAGCNRIVNNVSWGPSGLVSFGAQNAVAIFSPEVFSLFCITLLNTLTSFSSPSLLGSAFQTAQILTTLPGHKATVNCTQWIPSIKDTPIGNLEFMPQFNYGFTLITIVSWICRQLE